MKPDSLRPPGEDAALNAHVRALRAEADALRAQLREAEAILGAIRAGEVDAVVVGTPEAERVYTLTSAEQPYRILVEAMQEGAVTLGRDGTILYANQGFARLVGTPLEKVIGASFERFVPAADADRFRAFLAETASRKAEMRLHAAGGSEVAVYLSASSAAVAGLETVCLVVTDLTEQKRHEERVMSEALARSVLEQAQALNRTLEERVARRTAELSRANLALTQRNRELQDFAYVASHDLQEPLRKISSFSNLFRAEYAGRVDEQGHFYLQRIQDAANRMSDLIRDLLAYSRVVTHGKPFREVDLGALAAEVRADLDLAIAETGATVEIGALPRLFADPYQVRQLLLHLVSNALKFRRPGAAPVVRLRGTVERRDDGEVPFEVAVVEVEDEGIGFDEKYLDRIFTPFQRLHGRGQYPGTGMGLAICRRIVERHDGTLTARSTPAPARSSP